MKRLYLFCLLALAVSTGHALEYPHVTDEPQ